MSFFGLGGGNSEFCSSVFVNLQCSLSTSTCLVSRCPAVSGHQPGSNRDGRRRARHDHRCLVSRAHTCVLWKSSADSLSTLSNRLVNSCHAKCISERYAEPDLNKGEGVCIDRCTAKFFEVRPVSVNRDVHLSLWPFFSIFALLFYSLIPCLACRHTALRPSSSLLFASTAVGEVAQKGQHPHFSGSLSP